MSAARAWPSISAISRRLALGLWAVMIALHTPPASAEDMTRQGCGRLWVSLQGLMEPARYTFGTIGMDQGWCVVDRLVVTTKGRLAAEWRTDRIRFRSSAFDGIYAGAAFSAQTELELKELQVVPKLADLPMAQAIALRAVLPVVDIRMTVDWDRDDGLVSLSRAVVDFPGENDLTASALLTGLDLSTVASARGSLEDAAITDLDLRLDTDGYFAPLIAMAMTVAPQARKAPDPAKAMVAVRDRLAAGVAELPGRVFAAGTKSALGALLQDLPDLRGTLTLAMRTSQGIDKARLDRFDRIRDVDDLAPALSGVRIDITWPAPPDA